MSELLSNPSSFVMKGVIIHTPNFGELELIRNGAIFYDNNGVIKRVVDISADPSCLNDLTPTVSVMDYSGKMILPGLIDAHCHAPQYVFAGTGNDLPLLDWLQKYTFPTEARFSDPVFAKMAYSRAVKRHLHYGTTCASYFATIHLEASKILYDVINRLGQRAYVGKVSMDRNSPDYYVETTNTAILEAEEFVKYCLRQSDRGRFILRNIDNNIPNNEISLLNHENTPLILPVITPRFVPTCTTKLMIALGDIAQKYSLLPIQSHLNECKPEVTWVAELHPEASCYTQVYEQNGLCNSQAYMAHCVHCNLLDVNILQSTQTGIVHCPASNFNIGSGVCDVRAHLDRGLKVGLGTDVAAGVSCSMLDAIRQTVICSRAISFQKEDQGIPYSVLSYKEAFYLATMGSADVLSMSSQLGSISEGKKLDCLVVDLEEADSPIDVFDSDDQLDCFQKFLFLGDDRNIVKVYVNGKLVVSK
mmetsp:Transcript_36877/g.37534  ORF Transcript_36877/g.37534 Transcript_36877/m.37534 type:complete len:475 (+) Transcript_36877:74-1498(+)